MLSKRLALIKRPLRLAGLIKRPLALPALAKKARPGDKLLVRDNMKSAQLANCPLLIDKTAIAATGLALNLDKAFC